MQHPEPTLPSRPTPKKLGPTKSLQRREQARKAALAKPSHLLTCKQCHKTFSTTCQRAELCGKTCHSAWFYRNTEKVVGAVCMVCGMAFRSISKGGCSPRRTCSGGCLRVARSWARQDRWCRAQEGVKVVPCPNTPT